MLTAEQRLKLIAKAERSDVRATATVLRDLAELLSGTISAELKTAIENIVTPLIAAGPRTKLDADRTYYVRTDGSDSNSGLTDSAGGAFLTLQKAWDTIQQTLDIAGYTVTVQIGDGTYTNSLSCFGNVVGQDSSSTGVIFQGNSATPGNVILSTTSATAITVSSGARVAFKNFEVRTTTSGSCIAGNASGVVVLAGGMRFGACASRHIDMRNISSCIVSGNYSIVGGAQRHLFATLNSTIDMTTTITVTLTGTPAFSLEFACSMDGGVIYISQFRVTYSGAATGKRYDVTENGVIDVDGGGATYLPGDVAGASATGGQYN